MTLDDSVHAYRLRVMARADVLGNVTLHRLWAPGLRPRRHGPRRGRPSAPTVQAERAILDLGVSRRQLILEGTAPNVHHATVTSSPVC